MSAVAEIQLLLATSVFITIMTYIWTHTPAPGSEDYKEDEKNHDKKYF